MSKGPSYDGEAEDPLENARGKCMENDHHVQDALEELSTCTDRVADKPWTAETCAQEMIDLIHSIDHCVGHTAFKKLA